MIWLITILSVFGAYLNAKKLRAGFLVWILANALWIVIDILRGIPEQAVLFVIYLIISLYGWITWGKKP